MFVLILYTIYTICSVKFRITSICNLYKLPIPNIELFQIVYQNQKVRDGVRSLEVKWTIVEILLDYFICFHLKRFHDYIEFWITTWYMIKQWTKFFLKMTLDTRYRNCRVHDTSRLWKDNIRTHIWSRLYQHSTSGT